MSKSSKPELRLYNTLSRQEELFVPVNDSYVTMYTCGPTVYDYQHIGNLRTATLMDTVQRSLRLFGYNVKSVMNITDVEDKIERRAKESGASVDEITSTYEKIYFECLNKMNIGADFYPHASEHIIEQIEIIKDLERKGYTYRTDYGVYFDVSKDSDYGKLGNTFKSDKSRSRIELTEQKKNLEDFVLWRIPQPEESREKLWDSPWGRGYPGWHIECSAMSMRHLSESFKDNHFQPESFQTIDIHIGGEDLKEVHHENEIAQSESSTGKPFVKYWIHGAMLNISGDKMSKSLGNFLTLKDVEAWGFSPLSLRLFYFTAHYRKELSFSREALEATQASLNRLKSKTSALLMDSDTTTNVDEHPNLLEFTDSLADDFNMPKAVAVVWKTVDDETIHLPIKAALVAKFDMVLGLDLDMPSHINSAQEVDMSQLPSDVAKLVESRDNYRTQKNWERSDSIRVELENRGYKVIDKLGKTVLAK